MTTPGWVTVELDFGNNQRAWTPKRLAIRNNVIMILERSAANTSTWPLALRRVFALSLIVKAPINRLRELNRESFVGGQAPQ